MHVFAAHLNGGHWTLATLASPAEAKSLDREAVSCAAPRACIAVGSYVSTTEKPFAERWNGQRWDSERPLIPRGAHSAALTDVSCSEKRSCTAVGFTSRKGHVQRPLVEHWNGTRWTLVRSPVPPRLRALGGAALLGISCIASSCVAIGNDDRPDQPGWFIERYS